MKLVRQFILPATVTLVLWNLVLVAGGVTTLITAAALTGLEVLLSFDNAAVNARLLRFLSPRSQLLFLTLGIFVAVFVVRFALPIAIVSVTASLPPATVVDLALHHADQYADHLTASGPAIAAFGGMFLFMLAAGFFLDTAKEHHWLGPIERRLCALGERENVAAVTALITSVVVALTMGGTPMERFTVLVAACVGIGSHMLLDLLSPGLPANSAKVLVGGAAVVMLIRLEVLDASFSFDGVIGAFAFSNDVVIIAACLGAGAMWVRSLTVYLLRSGVMDAPSARFLEHGAHWAIFSLAVIMITGIYVDVPEWVPAGAGIVIVGAAIYSSIRTGNLVTSEVESARDTADTHLKGRADLISKHP